MLSCGAKLLMRYGDAAGQSSAIFLSNQTLTSFYMRTLILPFLLFVVIPCFGQTREYYVDVHITGQTEGSIFDGKYSATIDTGTGEEGCVSTICREDSSYVFESEMSVVNFMADKGWQLLTFVDTPIDAQAAFITEALAGKDVTNRVRVHHYIMKKSATSLQQALEGLILMDRDQAKKLMKAQKKQERRERFEEKRKSGDDMYY